MYYGHGDSIHTDRGIQRRTDPRTAAGWVLLGGDRPPGKQIGSTAASLGEQTSGPERLWVTLVSMEISDEGSGEAKYVDGKAMVGARAEEGGGGTSLERVLWMGYHTPGAKFI